MSLVLRCGPNRSTPCKWQPARCLRAVWRMLACLIQHKPGIESSSPSSSIGQPQRHRQRSTHDEARVALILLQTVVQPDKLLVQTHHRELRLGETRQRRLQIHHAGVEAAHCPDTIQATHRAEKHRKIITIELDHMSITFSSHIG